MAVTICPNCGAENPAGNQFCQSCGKALPVAADAGKTVLSGRKNKAAAPPPPVEVPPPMPISAMVPPPPPPPMTYSNYLLVTPIRKLGIRSDGYSDVIEDAAPLAEKVKGEFLKLMSAAGIPGLHMAESDLVSKGIEIRRYQVIDNGKGSSVAVRIATFGKHLVISWDLFSIRKVNWLTIGILGGAVFLFTLLPIIFAGNFAYSFFAGLYNFIGSFLSWLLVPGLGILLFGKLLKDNWLAFYATDLDDFAADDGVALSTVVDNALSLAVEKAHDK